MPTNAQWKKLEKDLKECFEGGMTDAATAKYLTKGRRKVSASMVRSKRNRMEKRGLIKRGLAASSVVKGKRKKLPRRQVWTKQADALLTEMAKERKSYSEISRALVKQKLRRVYQPKAVACRASSLKVAWGRWKGPPRNLKEEQDTMPKKVGKSVGKSGPKKVGKPLSAHSQEETVAVSIISTNGTQYAKAFSMTQEDARLVANFCEWVRDTRETREGADPG